MMILLHSRQMNLEGAQGMFVLVIVLTVIINSKNFSK